MNRIAACITALAVLVLYGITVHFTLERQFPLPFSDTMGALIRLIYFEEGKLGWYKLLFLKHGEHFHAGVYALLYADLKWLSGQQALLLWANLFSHLAFFGFLAWRISRSKLDYALKIIVTVFAALLLASLTNVETWLFPFQAVLTSFRLWMAVALWLYASGLEGRSMPRLAGALLMAAIGMFLHGGGILLPLLFTVVAVARRKWEWAVIPLFLYLLFAAVNHWADQFSPAAGLSTLLKQTLSYPWQQTVIWALKGTATFLSHGLLHDEEPSAMWAGAAGLALMVAVSIRVLWQPADAAKAFFLALMAYAVMSAALASIMIVARIPAMPESFNGIYSSRYIAVSTLFWISLAVLIGLELQPRILKLLRLLAVALLVLGTKNYIDGYGYGVLVMNHYKAGMERAVAEVKNGRLSKESYVLLLTPIRNDAHVDYVLGYLRANRKSVFAE